ncbi:MAG: hypothetical protein JWR01_2455, partial [Subtercola sp.]|nr:hypothetical protein [Subtercola sp.]
VGLAPDGSGLTVGPVVLVPED